MRKSFVIHDGVTCGERELSVQEPTGWQWELEVIWTASGDPNLRHSWSHK